MKVAKRLLMGSACAFAASSAVVAADLPARKAAPIDYVRVCDFTGAGFFYIPGTDTCMQVGGIIRTEFNFISNGRAFLPIPGVAGRSLSAAGLVFPGRDRDITGYLARARLSVDTRTQTAYGTLRTYIQYQIDRVQGLYGSGGLSGGQNTFANQGGNNAALRRGFIQFAGITAGRIQSFFDFYADNYNYEGIANSDLAQNVLAYTYTVGGGFSTTLSIEDHTARNDGVGTILGGAFALPVAVRDAGQTVPDIVGVLRYDQPWGAAQLSAAYHALTTNAGPFAGTSGQGFGRADDDGFAVQGGLRFKLPMIAAGDDLWLQGAYEQGAYLYQDSVQYLNQGFTSPALAGFLHVDHDVVALRIPGASAGSYQLEKVNGFSALAAFNHYFTPHFHDVLFGSYEQTGYGNRVKNIDWTLGGIGDGSEYRVGNQFLWDPVKNLEIGLELDYLHIDQTLAHNAGVAATALPTGVALNPDAFETRLRVERDF